MTDREIEQFVKLVTSKYISIAYEYSNSNYLMYVPSNSDCIIINKYYKINNTYLKMALLHEVGHILNPAKSKAKAEYKAQMYAINKAKELNMPKVVKEGVKTITEYWKKIKLPHCHKEHHLAHKMYMKVNTKNN